MEAYARLTDGILDVIKEQIIDEEVNCIVNINVIVMLLQVQDLIERRERSKYFVPIGYIKQYQGNRLDLVIRLSYILSFSLYLQKSDIMKYTEMNEGELQVDNIIIDVRINFNISYCMYYMQPMRSGYESSGGQSMYYISSDGNVEQWSMEWVSYNYDY